MKLLTRLVLATFVCFFFLFSCTHSQSGQGFGQGQGQGQGFGQGQGYSQGQGQGYSQGQGQGFDEGIGDAVGIMSKALYCFNEKIYSSCAETYRLTESGELHVPQEDTDNFCDGPCHEETNLVLECIEGVMHNFVFYNKATTGDIRETLSSGCGYGPTRGEFDVAKYADHHDEYSAGLKAAAVPVICGILSIIISWALLL